MTFCVLLLLPVYGVRNEGWAGPQSREFETLAAQVLELGTELHGLKEENVELRQRLVGFEEL